MAAHVVKVPDIGEGIAEVELVEDLTGRTRAVVARHPGTGQGVRG